MQILKTLRLGRLPAEADLLIRPQHRKVVLENLAGSITYYHFRSPRRVCAWRRQWFAGSIAVSDERIIAYQWCTRLINTPFNDPRFSELSFTAEKDLLLISHDASLYHPNWSGFIEHRFRTPHASRIAEIACAHRFSFV